MLAEFSTPQARGNRWGVAEEQQAGLEIRSDIQHRNCFLLQRVVSRRIYHSTRTNAGVAQIFRSAACIPDTCP